MRLTQKKVFQLLVILGVFTIAAIGAIAVSYFVYVQRSDAKIVRTLGGRLPVAKTATATITYADFLDARDTIRIYFASDAAKQQGVAQPVTTKVEKDALDRLVRQAVVEELAKEKNVGVKDEDVKTAFDQLVLSTSTTMPDVSKYLKETFGWTEDAFRTKVIRASLLEEKIISTYASSSQAAAAAYETEIQTRLAKPDVKYYLKIDATAP